MLFKDLFFVYKMKHRPLNCTVSYHTTQYKRQNYNKFYDTRCSHTCTSKITTTFHNTEKQNQVGTEFNFKTVLQVFRYLIIS